MKDSLEKILLEEREDKEFLDFVRENKKDFVNRLVRKCEKF